MPTFYFVSSQMPSLWDHVQQCSKNIFRFLAQQIPCGHNRLSENKLAVKCNLSEGSCFVIRMVDSPF